jgi:predicted 3-demethylubiquinone-9 3-methyltransferase (glyoxalase superfamily)
MQTHTKLLSNGLWFDSEAAAAVAFYQSVFPDSAVHFTTYFGKEGFEIHRRPAGSIMSINFQLFGTEFQAINGGPVFEINPSVSYFILCDTAAEANRYWDALQDGGKVLMPIDKYDWSERYGWVQDKYGLSWQIFTGAPNSAGQKICPSLMFTGAQHSRAEEAVHFYTSVFKNSHINGIQKYPPGGMDPENTVMYAEFTLDGQVFTAMDSGMEHTFQFNEGISFIVNCTNQAEIDYYWDKLLVDGKASECGWLKDRFGMSWQVVPVQLDQMLTDPDPDKVARVTKAFLKMQKFDLQQLEDAFNG